MSNGIAIHDGNFGADWVNVTIDGKLICQVRYQPDGSQRVNAELVVKALNDLNSRLYGAGCIGGKMSIGTADSGWRSGAGTSSGTGSGAGNGTISYVVGGNGGFAGGGGKK